MTDQARLHREIAQFPAPLLHKSLSQLATSVGGFLATCATIYDAFIALPHSLSSQRKQRAGRAGEPARPGGIAVRSAQLIGGKG